MLVGWPPDFLRNFGAQSVPTCRRATEQRDELAPSQFIELYSIPSSQGRFAGYRMGRDRSAGLVALADYMLQRTLFQCPNFIY
jgi:hypothetical protein